MSKIVCGMSSHVPRRLRVVVGQQTHSPRGCQHATYILYYRTSEIKTLHFTFRNEENHIKIQCDQNLKLSTKKFRTTWRISQGQRYSKRGKWHQSSKRYVDTNFPLINTFSI